MLSLPHLVVLFIVALMVFGPQKLPELARMLGKATAEFRKMTSDFRYALEDEVRELERNTRIKEEEVAAAARAAQAPVPMPSAVPDGAVSRETPIPSEPPPAEQHYDAGFAPHADSEIAQPAVDAPAVQYEKPEHHEKPSDDNTVA